jgi:proteasome accessory factor A
MSEMQPRITGTEMEWSVQVRSRDDELFEQATPSEVNRTFTLKDNRLLEMSTMLSNGGRLYQDVGNHPEYATPEDVSFMGTVANEIAGENIMYDALVNAREKGVFHDFILNKRVVDDALNTWGYHVSLIADATKIKPTKEGLAPLGPHLATIGLYTGAGSIVKTNGSAEYAISQKVLNLNTDFSSSSHNTSQPLISLRNESLAPSDKHSRVHITSLDANISPWATWMKLGTTSIVLRMMEHGYWDSKTLEFEDDMHKVAVAVAYDPGLGRVIRQSDGKTIRALDVQGELLLRAKKMADSLGGLPGEEMRVLDEWERALADLTVDPDKLANRADWVLKRAALRRYMASHALAFSDDEVIKKDRQWSHIGKQGIGVKHRMPGNVWDRWMPHEKIEHAYLNAPKTTRALARASFIKEYSGKHYATSATWHLATAQRAGGKVTYRFDDPYSPNRTSLDVVELDDEFEVA